MRQSRDVGLEALGEIVEHLRRYDLHRPGHKRPRELLARIRVVLDNLLGNAWKFTARRAGVGKVVLISEAATILAETCRSGVKEAQQAAAALAIVAWLLLGIGIGAPSTMGVGKSGSRALPRLSLRLQRRAISTLLASACSESARYCGVWVATG